jgi:hypothetical protein
MNIECIDQYCFYPAIHDVLKNNLNSEMHFFIMHYPNGILTIWRCKIPDFYRQKFTNKLYPKGSEIILIQMNILLIKIKNQIET